MTLVGYLVALSHVSYCSPRLDWPRTTGRHVSPCVGDLGDSPIETDFFDVDPQRGVEISLMAHEVVFIPFTFLCLEPRGRIPAPSTPPRPKRSSRGRAGSTDEGRASGTPMEGGAGTAERSVVVAFVSTSHGHVVSVMQVGTFPGDPAVKAANVGLLPAGECQDISDARQSRVNGKLSSHIPHQIGVFVWQ